MSDWPKWGIILIVYIKYIFSPKFFFTHLPQTPLGVILTPQNDQNCTKNAEKLNNLPLRCPIDLNEVSFELFT